MNKILVLAMVLTLTACHKVEPPKQYDTLDKVKDRIENGEAAVVRVCLEETYIVKLDDKYYVQHIHSEHNIVGVLEDGVPVDSVCQEKK